MKSIIRYFKGVGREAKRVKWPESNKFLSAIIVVILIAAFAGIFLSLEDYASSVIIEQLRQAFESI